MLNEAGTALSTSAFKSAQEPSVRIRPHLKFAHMACALRFLMVSVFLAGSANAQAETTFPIANSAGREASLGTAFDGTNFLVGIQGDASVAQSITAQLVAKSGALVGSRIATGATGGTPRVAFDGTNYLLAWECDASPTTCIQGQFVSTSGALVGSQFTIATNTYRMALGLQGLIFDGTNYFVVWRNDSTSGGADSSDVLGQFITTSGAKLGSVVIVSNAAHGQRDPSIAFDGANILAIWADSRNQSACYTDGAGTHCSESDIYGQLITKSSASVAGTLSGNNSLISAGTLPRDNPTGIAFDGTNYLVTFIQAVALENACPSSGCNWEAYGILVSKTAAPIRSKFVLGKTTTSHKMLALPAYLGTQYLVSWTDGYGTIAPSVKGQYITTSGAADGAEFTLFSPPSSGAVPWGAAVFSGGGVNLAVTDWGIPEAIDASSYDAYTSTDVTGSLLIIPGGDSALPTAPSGLSATVVSSTQINLSWSAATDNVGVTQYKVFRTSLNTCPGDVCPAVYYSPTLLTTLSGTPPATAYSDTGLTPATRYDYEIQACDAAGNCSAHSNLAIATTTPATQPVALSLNLVAGWNLVGNSVQTQVRVADYFNDNAKVAAVWKWVTTGSTAGITYPTWAFYSPEQSDGGQAYASRKGFDYLTTLDGGEGFWVNAKTALTVQLPAGTAIASSAFQGMSTGWHLIATGSNETPSSFNTHMGMTQTAGGGMPMNITSLWAWDNAQGKWYFHAPSLEAQGGSALADHISASGYLNFTTANKTLGSGVGFWVNKP